MKFLKLLVCALFMGIVFSASAMEEEAREKYSASSKNDAPMKAIGSNSYRARCSNFMNKANPFILVTSLGMTSICCKKLWDVGFAEKKWVLGVATAGCLLTYSGIKQYSTWLNKRRNIRAK